MSSAKLMFAAGALLCCLCSVTSSTELILCRQSKHSSVRNSQLIRYVRGLRQVVKRQATKLAIQVKQFEDFKAKQTKKQSEVLKAVAGRPDVTSGNCKQRTLGYRYQSRHNARNGHRNAQLTRMVFPKKKGFSVLKFTYSSNIRSLGGSARWNILIDGRECTKPTKIDIGIHTASRSNSHYPSVLTGICEATSAGPISAGNRVITVRVGGVPRHRVGHSYSGWESTSILEVEEMCPQF